MTFGKFEAVEKRSGLFDVYLDGQKLAHVRGFTVDREVGHVPTVTVTFLATATTAARDDGDGTDG